MDPEITPEEAIALIEQGVALVDVRSPEEFQAFHIAEAVNIPLPTLEAGLFGGLPKEEIRILLMCSGGRRAARAVEILKAAGYTQADSAGGIQQWMKGGYPLQIR
jgi:phage shock protein E